MDHRKRLEWAREHLHALHDAIGVFGKDEPCTFTPYFDPQTATYQVYIDQVKPTPERWNLQVGDIVHNLHAALDNLAFALALKQSGTLSDGDMIQVQFPICDHPKCFTDPKKGQDVRRLYKLAPNARAAIERLQPYNRPDKSKPSLLSILRDLSNREKHRHILFTTSVAMNTSMELSGPGITPGTRVESYRGPLIPDTVVALWRFDPPVLHPKVNVNFHFTFDIDFPKGSPGEYNSVCGLLYLIGRHLDEVIFPPLEALL